MRERRRLTGMPIPNRQLRAAREAMPSKRVAGASASREEVAEAVALWLAEHDPRGRTYPFDANHLGKIERGVVQRPSAAIRAGLRAVLGATDPELGFAPVVAPPDAERLAVAAGCARRTDQATVDALAAMLAATRRLEDETSAADVVSSVADQHRLAQRLAAGAADSVRAAAVGLVSEFAQYLGWLSIPLGRWDDARRHLDRAAVLALEVDDPLRLATALSFQAYAALRCGDCGQADALSEAASRDARVNAGLRTYSTFQRAEVLAHAGDRAAASRTLVEADRSVEQLPPQHELPPSGYWYTPAFFVGQRGFMLAALGDTRQAGQAARDCLDLMPAEWAASEWATRRRELAEV